MKQQHEATAAVDYKPLNVMSSVFDVEKFIPAKYTCEGEDINPPITIENIPKGAKSLAIIVDDPDAPSGDWVYWIMWNIPVTHLIKENDAPGMQGLNSFKKQGYNGPCPPSGTHRYFFKVYALNSLLQVENVDKADLEKAMSEHIIGFGEMIGLYSRKR